MPNLASPDESIPLIQASDQDSIPVSIADKIEMNRDNFMSKANAALEGNLIGVSKYASTIQKIITPYTYPIAKHLNPILKHIGIEARSPESVQPDFEQEVANYNRHPDVLAHPGYAGAGEIAGGMEMTMAIPASAPLKAASAGKALFANAPKLIQGIGYAVGGLLGGAGTGALYGGLSNEVGNENIINQEGAKSGAKIGAALFPVQAGINRFSNKTTELETLQKKLEKTGTYNVKIFSADTGPGQGVYDSISKGLTNSIAQKLPSYLGTNPYRQAQLQQLTTATQDYVHFLSNKTMEQGTHKIGKILENTVKTLDNDYNAIWNTAKNALVESGVKTVPRISSQQPLKSLLNSEYNLKQLTSKEIDQLTSSVSSMTPQSMLDFKKDVWKMYSRLATKLSRGTASADESDTANKLLDLYWTSIDDIKQAAQHNPDAIKAFEAANQYTVGYKELFDPKKTKFVSKLVADLNRSKTGLRDFISFMLNPKTTPQDIYTGQRLLGNAGTKELAAQGLRQALDKSLDKTNPTNPILNVSSFVNTLSDLKNSNQRYIYGPALDAMEGLVTVMNQYAAAAPKKAVASTADDLTRAAVGVGLGTGAVYGAINSITAASVTVPAILASSAVYSFLAANSPLKNSLIWANKMMNKPGASQYWVNRVGQQLIKAGIMWNNDEQGNIHLDKKPIQE